MRCIRAVVLVILLLGLHGAAFAQGETDRSVAVFHRGSDTLGQQLADRVREKFEQASGFNLDMEAELLVIVHTRGVSGSSANDDAVGVVNVIWTLREGPNDQFPQYLESTLGYTGGERMEQVSDGVVSDTRQIVSNILPRMQQAE